MGRRIPLKSETGLRPISLKQKKKKKKKYKFVLLTVIDDKFILSDQWHARTENFFVSRLVVNLFNDVPHYTGPGRGRAGRFPGPRSSTLRCMKYFVHSDTLSAQEQKC
jgi:hypothetical protein